MSRGGDMALFPGVERDGDLSAANACRLGGPNQAIEIAPSAAMFQLVPLPHRRQTRLLRCVRDFDNRIRILRNHSLVVDPGSSARSDASGPDAKTKIRRATYDEFVSPEKRHLPRPAEMNDWSLLRLIAELQYSVDIYVRNTLLHPASEGSAFPAGHLHFSHDTVTARLGILR